MNYKLPKPGTRVRALFDTLVNHQNGVFWADVKDAYDGAKPGKTYFHKRGYYSNLDISKYLRKYATYTGPVGKRLYKIRPEWALEALKHANFSAPAAVEAAQTQQAPSSTVTNTKGAPEFLDMVGSTKLVPNPFREGVTKLEEKVKEQEERIKQLNNIIAQDKRLMEWDRKCLIEPRGAEIEKLNNQNTELRNALAASNTQLEKVQDQLSEMTGQATFLMDKTAEWDAKLVPNPFREGVIQELSEHLSNAKDQWNFWEARCRDLMEKVDRWSMALGDIDSDICNVPDVSVSALRDVIYDINERLSSVIYDMQNSV